MARTTGLSVYSEGWWRVVGKAAPRRDRLSGNNAVAKPALKVRWCACRVVTSIYKGGRTLILGCCLLSRMFGQTMAHVGNPWSPYWAVPTRDPVLVARLTLCHSHSICHWLNHEKNLQELPLFHEHYGTHKHNKLTSIISMETNNKYSTTEIQTDLTVHSVQT